MSIWAERVENILLSRGFTDLTNQIVNINFLPAILAKLPPDVARDAPTSDVSTLLRYLKTIDKIKYDLNQCFIEGRKLDKAPSQAFNALVNRVKRALPRLTKDGKKNSKATPCTEEHVKTVAWTSLKAGLPDNILTLATVLGVRYFPSSDDLEALDDAWADHVAKKNIPNVFSVRHEASTKTSTETLEANKHFAELSNIIATQQNGCCAWWIF